MNVCHQKLVHQLQGALAVNVVEVVDQHEVVDFGVEDGIVADGKSGNELVTFGANTFFYFCTSDCL